MPSALEEAQLCHRFSPALVGKCRNADFSKNIWGFFFLCFEPALKGLGGVRHDLFGSTLTFFRLSGKNFSKLFC